jgi:nitroimidazol reductase NimA-like FMN-containing flavoprotein (pyridoxamine 5'-phosphate oxidase superfamily)
VSPEPSAQDDRSRMERILREDDLGHLAMATDGELYIVPINYAYAKGRILFHCALEGRKLDMIRANPQVCFEISRQEGRPAPHPGDLCDADESATFESVICWGVAKIVDDPDERHAVLNEFQERYNEPEGSHPPISLKRAANCGAVEITVQRMTGRRKGDGESHAWAWEG